MKYTILKYLNLIAVILFYFKAMIKKNGYNFYVIFDVAMIK